MDEITEKLDDITMNENNQVENASEENKSTQCSWLNQFQKNNNMNNNQNNNYEVDDRREQKSNHGNDSFDNSRSNNSISNSSGNNTGRGRGRGLNILQKTSELFNNDHSSNNFNHRGSFTPGYRGRGFVQKFMNENVSSEGEHNSSYNNRRGNNTTSCYRDRDQGSFRRFSGENESFENGDNGNINNRGHNFASGHRGRGRGYYNNRGGKFRDQFNYNNSLCGNNNNSYIKKEKIAGPKKEYIPPDIESNENIAGIVAGQNFDKYDTYEVKVSGTDPPKRLTSFSESGLREILLDNLSLYKFEKPTPIQNFSIPIIMAGRDLMASAVTGSGKTAAYVLPILHNLLTQATRLNFDENHCEPHVVIIAPTRELCIQINECVWKFSKGTRIKCRLLYGGASSEYQKSKLLESGVHVLTATPGRLTDFVEKNIVTFSSVKVFVLDEADRMLDLGFKKYIESILKNSAMVSSNMRQTLMFSATFPKEIQCLATKFLRPDYLFVAVGDIGGACKDVTQSIQEVGKFDKKKTLLNLLNEMENYLGTIVFVEQKRTADYIAAYLSEYDFPTTSIHGDREQRERELALREFKTKNKKILVATAVAARGLDITGVNNVVNFDLPSSIDEYVHRIGRTGRLGNSGKAISFFDPDSDRSLAPELIKILKQADQEVPQWLQNIAENTQAAPAVEDFNDIRTDVDVTSENFQTEEDNW